MALIFGASTRAGSFENSSRFLKPLLLWLFPGISDLALHNSIVGIRKCGHAAEYAVLALLCWRAFRKPVEPDPRPWDWPLAGRALLVVMLYAATDELHQLFVASRQASLADVLIDSSGGGLALIFLWGTGRCLRRW